MRCQHCGAQFQNKKQLSGHVSGKHLHRLGLKNATIRMDEMTEAQVGYVAAFLDGEGGIQITRSERKDRSYKIALHPMVYFTNTFKKAIETIWGRIHCGTKVFSRAREGREDSYLLHVTGIRNIRVLLSTLLPHLIIKEAQARLMLEFCESRLSHYRGADRQFSEKELQLYSALHRLKERCKEPYQRTVVLLRRGNPTRDPLVRGQTPKIEGKARKGNIPKVRNKRTYVKRFTLKRKPGQNWQRV